MHSVSAYDLEFNMDLRNNFQAINEASTRLGTSNMWSFYKPYTDVE